ncbi:AraC family transcriptional regulator [Sphingobacterium sp. JB170]|uniref:helix-turn-helix domain-containing protein n=1 Tax=Sphingobacterium sp. JB170 TaxID=1434842 RepID=UPI00097F21DE|nr:AraC family transcriptional regulator [Sphingobacterium sp. JB170]SJN22914.1 Transcriptional regulator, AraC family [Sphingobacterium sp. JB170]
MELIASNLNGSKVAAITVSDGYDLGSELIEHPIHHGDSFDEQFRLFHTDGLILIDVHSEVVEQITACLSFNSHIVAMVFHLEGDVNIMTTGGNHDVSIRMHGDEHNVEVINSKMLKVAYEPGAPVNSFIVLLSRGFCLRVMPQEHDRHNKLLSAVNEGNQSRLSPEFAPLSQDMKRIIENVRNCSRKGSFHRLCLEIKIAELLMLQLEQQYSLHAEQIERPMLHNADMEKIEEAKRILEVHYIQPPTIKDLALTVGLNETKLKADFKRIYNSTIHAYTQRIRMQKAHQLLTQKNLLLKEIALQVGYQKPSNFTAAFKEFFGVHPGDIGSIKGTPEPAE